LVIFSSYGIGMVFLNRLFVSQPIIKMAVPQYCTLGDIEKARQVIFDPNSAIKVLRTPLIIDVGYKSEKVAATGSHVSLKLENMQTMGSFKIRGIVNVMKTTSANTLVTMSAGNYGRSFSYVAQKNGIQGVIVMPETVPTDRIEFIKSCGMTVELAPVSGLMSRVEHWVSNGYTFAHPFDDLGLIAGYGTIGLEILEDLPDVDVLLVCVGGGGLLSGILTAVVTKITAMYGNTHTNVRVIGVEPEGASSMYQSIQQGKAVSIQPKTIAHGLAPPYAGKITYAHVNNFGAPIVLVSDEEIKEAVKILYNDYKIVSETSGAAAFAALINRKVPDIQEKKVACVISGGNIGIHELHSVLTQ